LTNLISYRYTLGEVEEDQKIEGTESVGEAFPPKEEVQAPSGVSFSSIPVRSGKSKGGAKTFLGIFILVIFIVGGFLIFRDKKSTDEATPTPETQGITITNSVTPTPVATVAPEDKSKVSIEIQNGTGIVGEAAYLRDILKSMGYAIFTVGNFETQDNVTTLVTFSNTLNSSIQDEVVSKLKIVYKEVDVKSSSTQKKDIVIVTGLKKGSTAKPSATPTPKATPSASPSATPTSTPSPTPT